MTRARTRVVWTATGAGIEESGNRPSRFLLAAAGVDSVSDLGRPPDHDGNPVSALEVETVLRRALVDPTRTAAVRLAAATVLARPGIDVPWDPRGFAGLAEPGPDTGLVERPVRLSPSQAESYETCPRRYAFERRVRLSEPASPYLTFGSLVHAVLESAERAALTDGRAHSDVAEALGTLDRIIAEADFGSPVLAEAWRRRATELIQRLYREWPSDSVEVLDLERTIHLELDGVRWIGRVDRIERTAAGAVRIVDYKTGSTPATRLEAATSLQLGFYVMAAIADEDLAAIGAPFEAQLWYPLAKAKSWRPAFDRSTLPTVRERLAAAAAGISGEDWTPRVGAGCRGCPVRLVCDRWPEGREAFVE